MTITNATNAYHPVKQPMNANRVQTLLQPSRQPSDQTPEGKPPSQVFISALPTLDISIPVTTYHQFSSWHFPKNLSQSSIQGRSGRNACTIIALTIAKLFYKFPLQSIDPTAAINSTLTLNQGSTTIF